MGYRNVYIENPARLSVKRGQLVIAQEEEYTLPIEDLQAVMIESKQCTLTAPVLSALANEQVALFTCDERHLPCSITLPLANHSRKLQILHYQLELSKKAKDRLWQKIIKQKILNQGKCLQLTGNGAYIELEALSREVIEGDKGYKESQAARFYFPELFGKKFSRSQENIYNASLNYGYAILRGVISRELCSYGFEPSLGIFHRNEMNPFNLADDIIEAYRPYVDLWVFENVEPNVEKLTSTIKKTMFELLTVRCLINGEYHALGSAIRLTVQSLSSCYKNNTAARIKLPELVTLVFHEYE